MTDIFRTLPSGPAVSSPRETGSILITAEAAANHLPIWNSIFSLKNQTPPVLELFRLRQRFLSDAELKALINQDEDGAPPEVGGEGGSDRFLCKSSLFI